MYTSILSFKFPVHNHQLPANGPPNHPHLSLGPVEAVKKHCKKFLGAQNWNS